MLNRLLGIVYILMKKGTVPASALAERFEVSARTIYRDVDKLAMAGIPVYARKGKQGGICLTERFVLDRMLVTREEQGQILAALESLKETGAWEGGETLRKISDFFKMEPVNWVAIDFSDWSGQKQELFGTLRRSILEHRVLTFDYYGQYGQMSGRTVEPSQLLFKEYTWYVRAYCRDRKAVRLFKVLRMKRVKATDETFVLRAGNYPAEDGITPCAGGGTGWEAPGGEKGPGCEKVRLLIDASEAYRVYDRFEEEEIERVENGGFRITTELFMDDWAYGFILSFGEKALVLEPARVREEVAARLQKMLSRYSS